jgi:hypothetical protein
MVVANTLAHYDTTTITVVISFVLQAPEKACNHLQPKQYLHQLTSMKGLLSTTAAIYTLLQKTLATTASGLQ